MRAIILVGLGGGIGSILRYLTSLFIGKYAYENFPLGTFAVNILGCFLAGVLIGLLERQHQASPDLKYLFLTGFCGGYTTFSAFASENMNLFQSGNSSTAYFYIATSILAGLLAVWFGLTLTKF